ncbi:Receptor-transporting protein 5 [Galemys pyrenaicus]|uniref:Receptor-transporting protein 5 n=1 Tax=Galemys pyrenaicus TaxID=202257 RepID=A0A8J5ZWE2_GALPY|nr:Receptor-transporting protein 5 [Galemys pyrenaicus]
MDGVDLWARTLAQLMAKRKPQDTWELLAEDDLAAGHLDSTGYQYRLRGLSRLQCGRCHWGWSSAHVHILFHLWWDPAGRLGLVKMRVWGQRCRLCPPEAAAPCQVSLLNVRLFLSKLVLFILQRCYREGLSAAQYPEVCFGQRCQACDLGVCFFQRAPDPAWGPEAEAPGAIKGRYTLYSDGGWAAPASGQQLLSLSRGPVVERARGCTPNSLPIPFSVSDFIRSPLARSSSFFSEDDVVTIPFSLVGAARLPGPRDCELTAGLGGLLPIGQGSIYLPAKSLAAPQGQGLPISIKEPVFQGRGILLNAKPFEVRGFIFKGRGAMSAPASAALPVSYIVGLMDNGEGSVTFPLSLAALLTGKGAFSDAEGTITFPFIFTDDVNGPDIVAGRAQGARRGPAAADPVSTSKGSITLPYLVFDVIKRRGPLGEALAARYYRKRRRPRSRCRRPSPDFHREDFCCGPGCCGPRSEACEETWIWVSMILFILWVIYLHKVNPDTPQRF